MDWQEPHSPARTIVFQNNSEVLKKYLQTIMDKPDDFVRCLLHRRAATDC